MYIKLFCVHVHAHRCKHTYNCTTYKYAKLGNSQCFNHLISNELLFLFNEGKKPGAYQNYLNVYILLKK